MVKKINPVRKNTSLEFSTGFTYSVMVLIWKNICYQAGPQLQRSILRLLPSITGRSEREIWEWGRAKLTAWWNKLFSGKEGLLLVLERQF